MKDQKKKYDFIRQEDTIAKNDLKKRIFIIGMIACLLGVVLTQIMHTHLVSALTYTVGFLCSLTAYFISRTSKNYGEFGIMLISIYFAFIYIPIDWFVYGGLLGSTPLISIVPLGVMVLALSKRKQKFMIPIYLVLLLSLTVYSFSQEIMVNNSARLSEATIEAAAYLVSISIITYALQLMISKLDKQYNTTLDAAVKDKLTGVLNRRGLDDVLAIAESNYTTKNIDYTVAMIDVDMLKEINDEFGHAHGDLLLKRLANCIERSVRTVDYVLRYGGDEFLVLLKNIPEERVDSVFMRTEGFLHEEYLAYKDFEVSFSRGFAQRKNCDSADSVVKMADKRMYEHKKSHRRD